MVNLILVLFLLLSNSGCNGFFELYPKEQVPEKITKILKKEYKIDAKVQIVGKTLWVYVPISYSLSQLYQHPIQKKFHEQLTGTLYTTGRILWNSKPGIEFYVVLFADTDLGAFLFMVGTTKDLKDYYLEKISIDEFSERRIYDQGFASEIIGDKEGKNFPYFDLDLPNFLAYLIAYRTEEKYIEYLSNKEKQSKEKSNTNIVKTIKELLSWDTEESPTNTYILKFYIHNTPPEGFITMLREQIFHTLRSYDFRKITYVVISTPQKEWSILPEEIFPTEKKTK